MKKDTLFQSKVLFLLVIGILDRMSGRKSTSVYDMPGTPLLTEPSEGNPFRDGDDSAPADNRRGSTASDPPMTPRPYDDPDLENRRKKRITCGGNTIKYTPILFTI